MNVITLRRLSILAVSLTSLAAGQSNPGSIQGTVIGEDGKSISGARVFAAVKSTGQAMKAPPTLANSVADAVNAAGDGSFTIPNLAPGLYILCAQTTVAGWLDPCHWSTAVPVINLASGQTLGGQTVVMAKGAVFQVRIDDPSKLLPVASGAVAHDVEVLALGSNNGYYHARIASSDATGRNHVLTLPFGTAHTLIVRSRQFVLADAKGAAVAASGHSEPVQAANGSSASQFTFTVKGKSN